jgi:hypothetical protein
MSHDSFQERCQLRRSRGDAPFFENFEEAEVHHTSARECLLCWGTI